MSFEFIRLQAKNFVLYKDLDIKFKELEGNLIFITGKNLDVSGTDSNCSGKTLIGDIFTDLLFDKTIRRHSQGSFIGKFDKWCSSSILIKDTISKRKYLIKKFRNHPKYGDKVFFIEKFKSEKKNLSRKKKIDTYRRIEKVLGINWRTFKNRNYFGQDDNERFLRVTDAKKAEIIVDIQDLSDFQKAKKVSNDNLKNIKKKEEICEIELKSLVERIALVKSLKNTAEFKRKQSLLDMKEELRDGEKEILKKKEERRDLGLINAEIFETEQKLNDIKGSVRKAEEFVAEVSKVEVVQFGVMNALAFETERGKKLTDKILQTKNEISDLKKQVVTICNKCGAKLTKERLLKSIKSLKIDMEENGVDREDSCKEIICLEIEKEKTLKSLNKAKKYSKALTSVLECKTQLTDDLKVLREKDSQGAILDTEIEGLNKYIEKIMKEIKKLKKDDYFASLIKETITCNTQKNDKEKELRTLKMEKEKNEFSKAVFDKTIRNLFDGFLDNLNHYSNLFLDDLCDNDISVAFTSKTERKSKKIVDEIGVSVSVDGSKPRDFRTYSGGEKGRIELVTQLVLFSSAESSMNFLFLDEPFEGVDVTGRERMITLLQNVSEKGNKVFVVSNKVVPQGYGSMLEVERKNGKAVINYG